MQIVPCTYQLLLVAVEVAVSPTVCSLVASVFLVPTAHGVKLGVAPDPPRNQRLPSVFFVLGPIRDNLKMQYSIEEQIMHWQLRSNIESNRQLLTDM